MVLVAFDYSVRILMTFKNSVLKFADRQVVMWWDYDQKDPGIRLWASVNNYKLLKKRYTDCEGIV